MERSNPETLQISETLTDLHVRLADVRMPVSDLAGGVLVVGQTSAGKTKSIVNNLARQFAEMFTTNAKSIREHRQFAIFYFGLKGRGHAEFIGSLSKLRGKDVITVSNDKTCPWVVRLFMKSCWRSREELHLSVVGFVEEVAERVARTRSGYRHDPFWDRQRVLLLSELSRLEINPFLSRDLINAEVADLVHEDALIALLARAEAFLEFIGEKVTSSNQPSQAMVELHEELRRSGFATNEDLARAEELVAFLRRRGKPGRHPKTRALCEFLYKRLQAARNAKLETPVKTLLERFADLLESTSQERLRKLIARWWRIPDNTRGVIETDLRGVIQSFRSGPAEQIFRGKNKQEITIEEIIHRGLILVIDLPASDSANANWPALVALKLAITQRLIGRYTAFFDGKPLSRRGAVILQDEAQLLLSDSEARALSVIREFGAIWILATQSISLIASVLKSHVDTAAFVAAARVRIWGNTGDDYTAEIASRFCGTSRAGQQRLTCLWHPTSVLEAAVSGSSSTEKPLVEPQRFYELKTGQFYVRTADNQSYFVDLRLSLPKPVSHALHSVGPAPIQS
jgi:hypothetical protein